MRGAALLALAILVLPACADEGGGSGGPSTDPEDLTEATWRLEDATLEELAPGAPDATVASLAFADGQVSGTSGCNSYFGTYEAHDDGRLSIGALGGTEMACEEPLMALESAYLAALGGVERFTVDDASLTLDGEVRLVFFEEVPPEPLPLVGTTWDLASIYAGDTVSSVVAGSQLTMALADDGSVSGTAGCDTYMGTYALDGASLSFGPLASTRMTCSEDLMAQEASFLDAMSRVESTAIEGTGLTLLDASGEPLLDFVGIPEGATA
jgi:heat shock protein HslJ